MKTTKITDQPAAPVVRYVEMVWYQAHKACAAEIFLRLEGSEFCISLDSENLNPPLCWSRCACGGKDPSPPDREVRVMWCLICTFLLMIAGCIWYPPPNLNGRAWERVDVEYWVPCETNQAAKKTWSSTEPDQLQKLQKAIRVVQSQGLSILNVNRANKVLVTMKSGQQWQMHFWRERVAPERREGRAERGTEIVSIYDPSFRGRSYRLELGQEFHDALAAMIGASTGDKVSLRIDPAILETGIGVQGDSGGHFR